MSHNIPFKIVIIYILLNCILFFPFISTHYFLVLCFRIIGSIIIGIYFGYHAKQHTFYQKPVKFFFTAIFLCVFWCFYTSYNMDCDIMNYFSSLFYSLYGTEIECLPIIFIYTSFIEDWSLLACVLLYISYHFSVNISYAKLKKI